MAIKGTEVSPVEQARKCSYLPHHSKTGEERTLKLAPFSRDY